MYERFTDRARKVMQLANQEAQRFNHEYIGTEHVLLGLLRDGSGVAAEVLKNLDVDFRKVRREIEAIVQPCPEVTVCGKLPQTPRTKKVIEHSIDEARSLQHNYVGTEHLLLGLLRESEGIAAQVLVNLGLKLELVRSEVLLVLGHNALKAQPASPSAEPGPRRTPTLDAVGEDLTELARQGKTPPLVGRSEEIERLAIVLGGLTRPCALLVGERGSGRGTLVEGLARRIVDRREAERSTPRRIVTLTVEGLLRGARKRAEAVELFESCLHEARQGSVLLFLEDLRPFLTEREGAFAAVLKTVLRRGPVPLIASLTPADRETLLGKDESLAALFEPIVVQPLSERNAVEVLRGQREQFERHHTVAITESALAAAVELAGRYLEGCLPGTALRLLDQASALASRTVAVPPLDLDELHQRYKELVEEKEAAVAEQDFEKGAALRDQADRVKREMMERLRAWKDRTREVTGTVDEEIVVEALRGIQGVTAIPPRGVEEGRRLLRMEAELGRQVAGQDEAIAAVSRVIRHSKAGLENPERPVGSFLFAGPPRSGKTHLARQLATFLFGDDSALLQIDMADFAELHTVAHLRGLNGGLVCDWIEGSLTEPLRRHPWKVVLLENIEKAHPNVWSLLAEPLDHGRLMDGLGRTIDFRHAVVILTTTIGSEELTAGKTGRAFAAEERVKEILKRQLPEELLERLDEIVVFRPLTNDAVSRCVDLEASKVVRRLRERGLELVLTDEARRLMTEECVAAGDGVLAARKTVERLLVDPLSEELLGGTFPDHGILIGRIADLGGRRAILFDSIIASDSPELTAP